MLQRYGVQAALLLVAAIWGWAFVVVADAIRAYPMYAFLGWRFALAAVAFVAFFPKTLTRFTVRNVRFGLLAGVLLSAGYIFQTWGLDIRSLGAGATTPARAAFITGLYVIITPLWQAVWLRVKPRRSTLAGAAIAVAGLAVMSGFGAGWLAGDTLVAICAVAYTLHLTFLGTGAEHDVGVVTFMQLATVALTCGIISAFHEKAPLPTAPGLLWALVLTGVLASAVAFAIQTWAQRKLPPARVAIILVMETAFGGLFGWSAAGKWPPAEVLGACIMFAGLLIAEALAAAAAPSERVVMETAVEGPPAAVVNAERDAVAPAEADA
jgi:drug/metabolite transporter (DMT)-like permease